MTRRRLRFESLADAVVEAQNLSADGYSRCGNWTLGQICRHLKLVQDPSVTGYPRWMSLFAPLRPLVRRVLLPRVLGDDSPAGIPTTSIFVPPDDVDDATEVSAFADSVERFVRHKGKYYPHPGFGRLDRESLEQIHAAHAAHHLGFLSPET